jgi:hypothetical protein
MPYGRTAPQKGASFAGTPPAPLERPPYDTAFGDDNHGYCLEPAFGRSAGWSAVASDESAAITVGPVQTQEGAVLGLIRRWNERGRPDRHFGHTGDRLEAFGFEEARASRAVMSPLASAGSPAAAGRACARPGAPRRSPPVRDRPDRRARGPGSR